MQGSVSSTIIYCSAVQCVPYDEAEQHTDDEGDDHGLPGLLALDAVDESPEPRHIRCTLSASVLVRVTVLAVVIGWCK